MKIINLKKFIRSVLTILGIALLLILLINKVTFSHQEIQYKTICVSEGDTLWNIAKNNQLNNEYYKDKDIRYILNDIIKLNNLDSSNINENQILIIPII